jgi:hypothetical protein
MEAARRQDRVVYVSLIAIATVSILARLRRIDLGVSLSSLTHSLRHEFRIPVLRLELLSLTYEQIFTDPA